MELTRRLNAFAAITGEGGRSARSCSHSAVLAEWSSCINVEVSLDFIQRLTAKGVLEATDAVSQNCRLEWGRMLNRVVMLEDLTVTLGQSKCLVHVGPQFLELGCHYTISLIITIF